MSIREIKKIQIISGSGVRNIRVGEDGVTEIKDHSQQIGDNELYLCYIGYDKYGKDIVRVENCPVVIDYKKEDDTAF